MVRCLALYWRRDLDSRLWLTELRKVDHLLLWIEVILLMHLLLHLHLHLGLGLLVRLVTYGHRRLPSSQLFLSHLRLQHGCIFSLFLYLTSFRLILLLLVLMKRVDIIGLALQLFNFLAPRGPDCRLRHSSMSIDFLLDIVQRWDHLLLRLLSIEVVAHFDRFFLHQFLKDLITDLLAARL